MTAVIAIQQLCHRYALAVDSRDIEGIGRLFIPEVRVGRNMTGRAALRQSFSAMLATCGATIHFIGNHTVDFIDDTHATGVVYCHEEVQPLGGTSWQVGMLQYWDDYEARDGAWLFVRRRVHRWYRQFPSQTATAQIVPGAADSTERSLPESFPTWQRFHGEVREPDHHENV
ncbi:nuclear transport factor 2 family protein [Frankia gtarii]|nr:nuclear transport factor 2 family protein [Frankia gtarii]